MDTHRTCSFAGSLIAVSWRLAGAASAHGTSAVVVVAAPFSDRGRVVAAITLRLGVRSARARVTVDGRRVASVELSCPLHEASNRSGHLFRDEFTVPAEFLDGKTHLLEVVVEAAGDEEETSPGRAAHGAPLRRTLLAKHETAFYARRVSTLDSRRELSAARPWDTRGLEES